MKSLLEIEFAIDYLRGHSDEDIPEDFPDVFSVDILNSYEKNLIIKTLMWVINNE